jgi:hypothetical protein
MIQDQFLKEAVCRWKKWNNSSLGPNGENYDFELDIELSKANAQFLINFFDALSLEKLSPQALAVLGAGIAENFLVDHSKHIGELEQRIQINPKIGEIFKYSWGREDMSQTALEFLKRI